MMNTLKLFASIVLLVSGLSSTSLALSPSQPALDKKWQSVVLLRVPGYDQDGSIVDGFCNGTLISPRLVVTAAHCIAGSILNTSGGLLDLTVGEYRYGHKPDGTPFRVGYVAVLKYKDRVTVKFPSGVNFNSPPNQISPENDFALIQLNQDLALPADFIFAQVWNSSIRGLSLQNPLVVAVNPVEYSSTGDTKQFSPLNKIQFSAYSAQSTSAARLAPGDSGSPLFADINNKTYLVGVAKGKASTFFSDWDAYAIWGERLTW